MDVDTQIRILFLEALVCVVLMASIGFILGVTL